MKAIHLKLGSAALVAAAFVTFHANVQAASLPPGQEIAIFAPALEPGDEGTIPVSAVQPGDHVFFSGKRAVEVDSGECGVWYLTQVTIIDPTRERPPLTAHILTDRRVPAGTRAAAPLFGPKLPCKPAEGYIGGTLITQ